MNKKPNSVNPDAAAVPAHGVLKTARFIGRSAGAPIGIVRVIRSVFKRAGSRLHLRKVRSPESITEVETRLDELIQRVHKLGGKTLPLCEVFNSFKRIDGFKTRIAELERKIYELGDKSMPLSEVLTRTTERARVIDNLVEGERRVFNTIFRHNLKLQKPKHSAE